MVENSVSERVIVALDCSRNEAIQIAKSLVGIATWVKVGMTLYYANGPHIVKELRDLGFKVFLDLKLYDIPHQVYGAVGFAVASGADMLTVHASGGIAMMAAAQKAAKETSDKLGIPKPAIIGVTVLTSFDDEGLAQVGIMQSSLQQVRLLGNCVKQAQLDGVVCSPHEAKMLREVLGSHSLIVTPGVRFSQTDDDDQARVATPAFAFEQGASHIVVGRPITQAQDKVLAFMHCAQIENNC